MTRLARVLRSWSIVCLLACSALASAAPNVTWITTDTRPGYIDNGPYAGQGFLDQGLAILTAALPQFDHQRVPATIARLLADMEHRDAVCSLAIYRTPEREAKFLYADRPWLIMDGFAFLIRADRHADFAQFLTEKGEMDLGRIASEAGLTGGILRGRAYHPVIEALVRDRGRALKIEELPKDDLLFNVVQRQRIDFAFVIRSELAYFSAQPGDLAKMEAITIAGVPRVNRSHVVCSKGPIGQSVIAAVNDWQGDDRNWAKLIAPMRRWFDADAYQAALTGK